MPHFGFRLRQELTSQGGRISRVPQKPNSQMSSRPKWRDLSSAGALFPLKLELVP